MHRATVDGIELSYELRGSGEPVVLIHWGVASAFAEPLLGEPALADAHQLLTYDRAGFGRSDRVEGPLTIADHARHCALLLRHLDIERAHVVGHSSSATIALQLALDFPEVAHTVVSMEAARPVPATELHADAFFGQELPALQQWAFTEDDARRIAQPVLLVLGESSTPTFPERRDVLLAWLPNAEPCDLAGLRHLLHVERPAPVAEALARFFAHHPLAAYA